MCPLTFVGKIPSIKKIQIFTAFYFPQSKKVHSEGSVSMGIVIIATFEQSIII